MPAQQQEAPAAEQPLPQPPEDSGRQAQQLVQQQQQQQQPLPPPPPPGGVAQGTCGWSDASLVRCGRFYPPSLRSGSSSEGKLRFYSRRFPCVEVDTTTYAIPRPEVTERWARAAAPGFRFHVKAFGLFCAQGIQTSSLPAEARALLPPSQHPSGAPTYVRLASLPPGVEDACWRRFHAALEPLYMAGRLGLVVFQFHLSFTPSAANLAAILRCRARLDARFGMAAELRCRRWQTDAAWRAQLCEALAAQGITLVSADELEHETEQRDREQTGLPPGATRRVLPIALDVTTPACAYVRLHRRHGTAARLLAAEEIEVWAARVQQQLAPRLHGPVWFLWGTDWEDAPMRNASALEAALPPTLRYTAWAEHWRQAEPAPANPIARLFERQAQRQAMAAAAGGTGDDSRRVEGEGADQPKRQASAAAAGTPGSAKRPGSRGQPSILGFLKSGASC